MRVSDIMIRKVAVVEPDATINEVSKIMREGHVGSIIVVDKQRRDHTQPIGIITDRDVTLLVTSSDCEPRKLCAEDIMSREIEMVEEGQSIMDAVHMMEKGAVRRLPVVDREGNLTGIISADDILNLLGGAIHSLSRVPQFQRKVEFESRK